MKTIKVITVLSAALLITACNPLKPVVDIPEGKIVGCENIKVDESLATGLILDCMDGKSKIDLTAIKGPAVVNFWGSWCGPCREEIPYFVDLANSLPDGLVLIGVDREEKSAEAAEKFIKDFGINYPQLTDPTGLSKSLVGLSVPVTIFINENGEIVYQHVGAIKSADDLRELVLEHFGI
jgi:cytochrome c biogenesis protein CcmG, thiol:disulfide interchange protein DsbE